MGEFGNPSAHGRRSRRNLGFDWNGSATTQRPLISTGEVGRSDQATGAARFADSWRTKPRSAEVQETWSVAPERLTVSVGAAEVSRKNRLPVETPTVTTQRPLT